MIKHYYLTPTNNCSLGSKKKKKIFDIYESFINDINKKILKNINIGEVDSITHQILCKINDFKKIDINFENNPYYIAMKLLLKEIDIEYKFKIYKDDIFRLTNEINHLKENCINNSNNFSVEQKHGIQVDCDIKIEYVQYIIKYGIPDDGIFEPSKLNELRIELGIYVHHNC